MIMHMIRSLRRTDNFHFAEVELSNDEGKSGTYPYFNI